MQVIEKYVVFVVAAAAAKWCGARAHIRESYVRSNKKSDGRTDISSFQDHRPSCTVVRLESSDDRDDARNQIECFCQLEDGKTISQYNMLSCLEIVNDRSLVNEQTMIVMNLEDQDLQKIFSQQIHNLNSDFDDRTNDGHLLQDFASFKSASRNLESRNLESLSTLTYERRRLDDPGSTSSPSPEPPTFAPIPLSTPEPSPEPVIVPSSSPIPDSTPPPIPDSTPPPIPAPTPGPTTKPPTPGPTTKPPTPGPTPGPSPSLSSQPSAVATPAPTKPPTPAPTPRASGAPTVSPLQLITLGPTPSPTLLPSDTPSSTPIIRPSAAPTREPTPRPTRTPDNAPTKSPYPTQDPTRTPTDRPSRSPSILPTREASANPSSEPSSSPTSSPTLSEQKFDVSLSIDMQLQGLMSERGQIIDFQLEVVDTINQSIKDPENDYGAPLADLKVFANFVDQKLLQSTSTSPGTRRLQLQGVRITLVIRVVFKSADARVKSDVETMVGDAFNNKLERQTFASELYSTNTFFAGATVDKVEVEGVEPEESQVKSDDSGGSSNIIVIAAAAGGGFIALLALGLLAFRRGNNPESVGTPIDVEIEEERSRSQAQTESKIGVSAEILVERQDDISTLGDPMFGMGGMMAANSERDEQTASIGNDYDYTKQYLRAQGLGSLEDSRELSRDRLGSTGSFDPTRTNSSNSGAFKLSGLVTPSIFSDDASFEQKFGEGAVENRFEVVVPPGKLGMVIDTPNGGVPAVRAIKPESVLASKVKVGDRLIAVDGDDVTAMTTVQVSKLISLKSDQQRVLAFLTTRDIKGRGTSEGA
ncbi:hypothetical protein ACA910_022180 [Epithemia clementina (nom. ined.)]